MKYIVDVGTGETVIEPLTEAEIAIESTVLEAAEERAAPERLAAEAKELSKESTRAKLAALGLTEDEIKALVG
jgi:hypothetical protein